MLELMKLVTRYGAAKGIEKLHAEFTVRRESDGVYQMRLNIGEIKGDPDTLLDHEPTIENVMHSWHDGNRIGIIDPVLLLGQSFNAIDKYIEKKGKSEAGQEPSTGSVPQGQPG